MAKKENTLCFRVPSTKKAIRELKKSLPQLERTLEALEKAKKVSHETLMIQFTV